MITSSRRFDMPKTSHPWTETEEMTESLCEAVAGSGTYMLNGQTQMQVDVMYDLLADLAKEGGDWRRIYGFIYEFWQGHRRWFPDVDTMAAMITEKRNSTKRKPA